MIHTRFFAPSVTAIVPSPSHATPILSPLHPNCPFNTLQRNVPLSSNTCNRSLFVSATKILPLWSTHTPEGSSSSPSPSPSEPKVRTKVPSSVNTYSPDERKGASREWKYIKKYEEHKTHGTGVLSMARLQLDVTCTRWFSLSVTTRCPSCVTATSCG